MQKASLHCVWLKLPEGRPVGQVLSNCSIIIIIIIIIISDELACLSARPTSFVELRHAEAAYPSVRLSLPLFVTCW